MQTFNKIETNETLKIKPEVNNPSPFKPESMLGTKRQNEVKRIHLRTDEEKIKQIRADAYYQARSMPILKPRSIYNPETSLSRYNFNPITPHSIYPKKTPEMMQMELLFKKENDKISNDNMMAYIKGGLLLAGGVTTLYSVGKLLGSVTNVFDKLGTNVGRVFDTAGNAIESVGGVVGETGKGLERLVSFVTFGG